MGRILLVRHGQASFGSDDYDALSELGFEQARLLGEALREQKVDVDRVVVGSMRRHRETAQACVATAGWSAGDLEVDPGWDEFDFLKVLAALPAPESAVPDRQPTRAEFQRWFEEATDQWIDGAGGDFPETFDAFTGRVEAALARLVQRGRTGTVAVFTSGGPLAWAAATVLVDGGSSALWKRLNRVSVNTGLTKLITGSRGTNLVTFNEHAHLHSHPDLLTYR